MKNDQRKAMFARLSAIANHPRYVQNSKSSSFGENKTERAFIQKAFLPGQKIWVCNGRDAYGNVIKIVVAPNPLAAKQRLKLKDGTCEEFVRSENQIRLLKKHRIVLS